MGCATGRATGGGVFLSSAFRLLLASSAGRLKEVHIRRVHCRQPLRFARRVPTNTQGADLWKAAAGRPGTGRGALKKTPRGLSTGLALLLKRSRAGCHEEGEARWKERPAAAPAHVWHVPARRRNTSARVMARAFGAAAPPLMALGLSVRKRLVCTVHAVHRGEREGARAREKEARSQTDRQTDR